MNPASTYIASAGYGWQTGRVRSADRAPSRFGGTDLTRDNNWFTSAVFAVDVPLGSYEVTVIMGDQAYAYDEMGVFLEGGQVATVTSVAGESVSSTHTVEVSDGQLNVGFEDLGGAGPNVVVQGIVVKRVPDSTAPVVEVTALLTNDPTPLLSGSIDDPNASVSVTVGGQSVSAVNDGTGGWSVADDLLVALSEGVYDVQVTAIDPTGNVGVDSSTDELEIDLTLPVVSVDLLLTNDATPSLSGSVNDPVAIVSVVC